MMGLEKTIDQMAVACREHWFGHVLVNGDGHVLSRAVDFEVERRRKKGEAKEDMEEAG